MPMRSHEEQPLRERKDEPLESNAAHEIWLRELTVGKRWTKAVWHRACTKEDWEEGPSLDSWPLNKPAILSRKTGGDN